MKIHINTRHERQFGPHENVITCTVFTKNRVLRKSVLYRGHTFFSVLSNCSEKKLWNKKLIMKQRNILEVGNILEGTYAVNLSTLFKILLIIQL